MFHTLYLEVTRRCNFSCPYCSAGSNNKSKWEKEKKLNEIVKKILLPAKEIGTKVIVFSGGEPFLYHDFIKLLEITKKLNFRIGIATNASLLNKDLLQKLKKIIGNDIVFSIGINSFDDKNSETRTKNVNFFLEKIKLLKDFNFEVNISITIGKFNCLAFANTVKKIKELGLPYNRIPFVPRNSNNKDLMIDKNSHKNYVFPHLVSEFNGYVSFTPFFLPEEEYLRITNSKNKTIIPLAPSVGCWVGSFYAINPSGDVAPCPLLSDNISLGNVYKENLKDILFKNELLNKLVNRNNLKGKCKNCKYNWTCGGCRTLAFYYTGDLFQEDPICFVNDLTKDELFYFEQITIKNFAKYYKMYLMSLTYG